MEKPLVSVIIPTYNRSHIVARAIESVAGQEYPKLEIILVDDGSSDTTAEVVAGLKVPGLRYFRHPQNLGANAARNTGIMAAHGEFVAFQDTDDNWDPRKLSLQIQALLVHGADICFCAFDRLSCGVFTRIPKPGYGIQPGCENRHVELLRGSYISSQTLVVRRGLLLKVGLFDETLPRLQDWELCLRLSKRHSVVYLDKSLVQVDVSDDSISRQFAKYALAADIILNKHAEDFRSHPQAAAMLCINLSIDALRHGRMVTSLRFFFRALWMGGWRFPTALHTIYLRR